MRSFPHGSSCFVQLRVEKSVFLFRCLKGKLELFVAQASILKVLLPASRCSFSEKKPLLAQNRSSMFFVLQIFRLNYDIFRSQVFYT